MEKGTKFRPTFQSDIDFFVISDVKSDEIITEVHLKSGSTFMSSIGTNEYKNALLIGEYKTIK